MAWPAVEAQTRFAPFSRPPSGPEHPLPFLSGLGKGLAGIDRWAGDRRIAARGSYAWAWGVGGWCSGHRHHRSPKSSGCGEDARRGRRGSRRFLENRLSYHLPRRLHHCGPIAQARGRRAEKGVARSESHSPAGAKSDLGVQVTLDGSRAWGDLDLGALSRTASPAHPGDPLPGKLGRRGPRLWAEHAPCRPRQESTQLRTPRPWMEPPLRIEHPPSLPLPGRN